MTDKQPEALRLSERISDILCASEEDAKAIAAAADELVRLHSENETLQAGYAAARLEIESLRARSTEPAGEYPALPDAAGVVVEHVPVGGGLVRHYQGDSYTADQMRAYVDADRAMRAAQPAGAQQPGAAYAALSDAEIDRIVPALEPVTEDFPAEWAVWKDRERIRKELRASHGQAPAQAAPAVREAVAKAIYDQWFYKDGWVAWVNGGNSLRQDDARRLADLAFAMAQAAPAAVEGCTRSHPHENMDSACRAKAAIAEMQNMAARGAEATAHDLDRFVAMLAAAPITQPAPQQGPDEINSYIAARAWVASAAQEGNP